VTRRQRIAVLAAMGVPLAALACNALSGAADLTVESPCDGCAQVDAPSGDEQAVVVPEAGADGAVDAATKDVVVAPPSFCQGIVMYARFDGTLTTAQGIAPESPPVTTFVPGRFGSGALLTGANGALFYVEGDAGVPYPRNEGTIAMWLKPQWTFPSTVDRVVWKPVADRTGNPNSCGPHMRTNVVAPGFFGSSNSEPVAIGGSEDVGGTFAELTPFWKTDWNHVVETWSRSSPTITFTLNGATGDASVTRRETDAGWTPQFPNVAYVRLSSNATPDDAAYDDVALWNRPLSLAEIEAVYGANTPLGDLCGL